MKSRNTKALITYCMGDFAKAIFNGLITTYLMYIYIPTSDSSIPVLLINAALTFSILRGIGAIMDAVIDLYIASKSDNLSHPLGRRIPFMRKAVIPWVLSCALIALVPIQSQHFVNTIWLAVMMFTYFISSSFYLVPYGALATEIVTDTKERVSFFTLSTFFFVLGSAVIYLTPVLKSYILGMGFSELEAWRIAFVSFSILAGICAFIPAFKFKEKDFVEHKPSYTPLIESFKKTFKYRNYTILSLGYLLMWVAFQFFNTSLLYYITMLIGQPDSFSVIVMGIAMIVGVFSYPLVNVLARKVGKKALLLFACAVYVLLYFAIYQHSFIVGLIGGQTFSILIGLVIGFPISITNIIPAAAFADLSQYDEIVTGENNAAMFMTARSFVQQLSQSIVLMVIPTVISLNSLDQKATMEGVEMTALIATIAIALALVIYTFYDDKETTKFIDEYNEGKKA